MGGTTALTSVTTDGATGPPPSTAWSVKTTGGQTYNDAVTLGADAMLTHSGVNSLIFSSSIDTGKSVLTDDAVTAGPREASWVPLLVTGGLRRQDRGCSC